MIEAVPVLEDGYDDDRTVLVAAIWEKGTQKCGIKRWERVDSFLKKWKMVQEGDSILLGISGGADSVCLARYFLARREALSLKLYAVHINHMLRGEEAKR